MNNVTRKIFKKNDTFIVPAGVTQVSVIPNYNALNPFYSLRATQPTGGGNYIITSGGSVFLWGPQDGTISYPLSPEQQSQNVINFFAGNNKSFWLFQDGMYATGGNNEGQLGIGNTTSQVYTTRVKVLNPSNSKYVAAYSFGSSFFLDELGNAYSVGKNRSGVLGDGSVASTTAAKSTPTLVAGGYSFKKLYPLRGGGDFGAIAGLTFDGDLYTWGFNESGGAGQLGDGTSVSKSSPVLVVGGYKFKDFFNGQGGGPTCFGITESDDAYAWGGNTAGSLGANITIPPSAVSSPVLVVGGLKWKKIVQTINNTTIGLTTSGQLYSWGANTNGALGQNNPTTSDKISSPVLVVGGRTYVDILSLSDSIFALDTNEDIYSWGNNVFGQLGTGDVLPRSSPTIVVGGLKFNSFCFLKSEMITALTTSGRLYSWGNNGTGVVGNGTNANSYSSPVLVSTTAMPFLSNALLTTGVMNRTPISVKPGESYSIKFFNGASFFGNNQIAYGQLESITVEYES
jgi:alpha-tubulin suppressor-like RCC1 family protein